MARALAASRATGKSQADDDDGSDGLDQLAELGGTVADALAQFRQQAREQAPADDIEVWEENVPVVQWFLDLTTQWNRSLATGLPTGLDYVGARQTAELSGLVVTPELFKGLQRMELAYIEECFHRAPRPGGGG